MTDETNAGEPPATWKVVRTTRASADILAQIRQVFFKGMKPGDWLGTEVELGERFGVSRITIRDAIRSLEAQGIVEVKVGARGGVRIAEPDPDRFADALSIQMHLSGITWEEVTEAMRAIELMTASLAAQRAGATHIERMRAAIAESERHAGQSDVFTERALDFHLIVAETAGNRALRTALRALRSVQQAKFEPNTSRDVAQRLVRMHRLIADAIASGDADAARAAMDEHLSKIASHGHSRALVC